MAKRSQGGTNTAAPAAPTAGLAASLASRSEKAPDLQGKEPAVIEWDSGNGVSVFQAGQLPPAQEGGETAAEADAAANGDAATGENTQQQTASTEQNQGDGDGQAGTVSPPAAAAAPAKPKGSEARSRTFAALESEQRRVALENQARQNADRATAAEAELARVKKLPLKEKLKWMEANREELEEALLVGGDDVAELPEKKPAAPDPELAELRETVRALKERDAAREQTASQQVINQAHTVVAEALKEVATVPLVKTVRAVIIDGQPIHSGIDLTLQTANQAWLQAGKAGHPRDYVVGAAEVVEQYLREKRPDLAELVDARPAAASGQPAAGGAPPARKPATTSIGKRTGARPDAQPTELPTDRYSRDQQIKREMGWT